MKNIIIYMTMLCIACLMVWIIKINDEVNPTKLYTVDTYYSYIVDTNETLDVIFYINQTHPLSDIDQYLDVDIENETRSMMLSMQPNSLKTVGEEVYLGEAYNKYMLSLDLPSINQSFYIDEAYIDITLVNNNSFIFYIGTVSLFTSEKTVVSSLDWTSLSAKKEQGILKSRLSEIDIEYNRLDKTISHIDLGVDFSVNYDLDDNLLTLMINDENQLFYACPVIIVYETGDIQIIDYFLYINDLQILKESGMMLNGYLLS